MVPQPDEIAQLMRFIAKKTKHVRSPMSVRGLAAEFKEKSGSLMTSFCLRARIERYRQKIHKMDEFDMDTKVKMMFALGASIDKGFLNEMKKLAEVEVDEKGRIINYQSNDGSLKLEGIHGMSSFHKSFYLSRWHTICEKASDVLSENNDEEDVNGQDDFERKRINFVRFLTERTKNATSPLSLYKLAKDYKTEFKSSEQRGTIIWRIRSFRERIHEMNQFDMSNKVKMMFALSSAVDEQFLKELQKDAIVELDEYQRIKKYKATDGSLELEGDHSQHTKNKAGCAGKKKRRVVEDSSESEDNGDEEDSSESDGSDEEEDGENDRESTRSKQNQTTSSARRSDRIQKSRISLRNESKKRQLPEKNSNSIHTRNHPRMSRAKKRSRISYSSSEASEDDEESMALEDPSMGSEANNLDYGGDDFDYDPPVNNHYDDSLEHNIIDPILERNIATPEVTDDVEEEEKKEEESSASSSAEIESMSLLELLNHLRSPILKYSPTLGSRIDENIKKLESEDQQIPINEILESFESCIQILNTPDEMDSDENTTSLSDFYYCLGMALLNIPHSSMDDFHVKMRKLATTGDKKVSMEHIRYAMGETLDKILH